MVLAICSQSASTDIDLRVRDIELAFNRRNYENILSKAQVLTTLLSTNKVHPQLAFQACGLFTDPDAAYTQSAGWAEERAARAMEIAGAVGEGGGEDGGAAAPAPGSQAGVPEQGDTEAQAS